METCEESIFKADLNILQYRYLTGVYIDRPLLWTKLLIQMRVTEQKKQACNYNIVWKVHNLGAIPKCKHIVPIRLGHNFGHKSPYTNVSSQLGWGVHHFGHKSPYINISSQLGWGVHHFGHKSPCINTSSQLGWGVHNLGHKTSYTNIPRQLGWGVHNFGHKSP